MQKKLSKILALLGALTLSASCAFGCGGNGENGGNGGNGGADAGDKVTLEVLVDSGGLGTEWVTEAGKRFAAANKNTNWGVDDKGKAKIGVAIKPITASGVSVGPSSKTATTAIYDLTDVSNLAEAVNGGFVLEINDIMTEKFDNREGTSVSIDDKIAAENKGRFTYNGKYYAAPSMEYYPGMAYDINLFDKQGYYFAKEGAACVAFNSTILNKTFNFVEPTKDGLENKSCGPDGVFGTDDDGLPSSLFELIALCEKMAGEGVKPLSFTGQYPQYSSFLLSGLTAALQGYERARAGYTFEGTFEVVTGYSSENLFPGFDGVKKPDTKTVTITEKNGYYASWAVEKYYAEAFLELANSKGWFSSAKGGGVSQKDAMMKFILSGYGNTSEKIGMHIDGSFWYNEANIEGYFDQWEALAGEGGRLTGRQVAWMALPVNFDTSVTEGNGKGQTMFDMWSSMLAINANVVNNPAKMAAAKAFVQFLCSDSELSKFTSLTSITKSLDYELTTEDFNLMSSYGQRLWNMTRANDKTKVVYFTADNATFKATSNLFAHGWDTDGAFSVKTSPSYYEYRLSYPNSTLEEIFGYQKITKETWKSLYKGEGGQDAVTD